MANNTEGFLKELADNLVIWASGVGFNRVVANATVGPGEMVMDFDQNKGLVTVYMALPNSDEMSKVLEVPVEEVVFEEQEEESATSKLILPDSIKEKNE